jgi:uncharacterized protein with GYD domain
MQRFIITMKLTPHGVADLEHLPNFCDRVAELWRLAHGEFDRIDITAGRFDLIATGTFPSALHAMQFSAALSADGTVTTETSPAVDHSNASDMKAILLHVHQTLMPGKKVDPAG